jgi:hypothetical protein
MLEKAEINIKIKNKQTKISNRNEIEVFFYARNKPYDFPTLNNVKKRSVDLKTLKISNNT